MQQLSCCVELSSIVNSECPFASECTLQRSPSVSLQADFLGDGFCLDPELQRPKQPCGSKLRSIVVAYKGKGRGPKEHLDPAY